MASSWQCLCKLETSESTIFLDNTIHPGEANISVLGLGQTLQWGVGHIGFGG